MRLLKRSTLLSNWEFSSIRSKRVANAKKLAAKKNIANVTTLVRNAESFANVKAVKIAEIHLSTFIMIIFQVIYFLVSNLN